MSDHEKFAVLARAIIELAKEATFKWHEDGEEYSGTGITLALWRELEEIAALAKEAGK
jgi:hypothetical protein